MQTFPENAREYIELAERAVGRFSSSQSIDNLFTALLATAHTFDFFHRENEGRPAEEADKQAFSTENPDWKTIRQLCNGAARARRAVAGELDPSPSSESPHPNQLVWVVPFQGCEQRLDTLCCRFLKRLKGRLSTGSLADPSAYLDDGGCEGRILQPPAAPERSIASAINQSKEAGSSMLAGFYDDLASVYHLLFEDWEQTIREQAECLRRLLPPPNEAGPILDCACGIGTQALGLAGLDYDISGSDLSPLAIRRARSEALARGYEMEFRSDDMRQLSSAPSEYYGVILCMGNSIPHLETEADVRKAIENMNKKLIDGGLIMFSIRDYDMALDERQTSTEPSFFHDGANRRILHHVWDWVDDRSYMFHVYLTLQEDAYWRVHHFVGHYRALRTRELVGLLDKSGFEKIEVLPPNRTGYYQTIVKGIKAGSHLVSSEIVTPCAEHSAPMQRQQLLACRPNS
ncbi:class I SAM-dependent methyltransferase [Bradyrhizobium brasilense]|uniref:class I SAM-dependent methyltransferase n=1 Tax=Bradyrhizobium brasilense TaxID=1419277 RepID=UPI002877A488|nr:class I SAM-dependent methyltransferase [Bradyrhizobium brasilense]MCP3417864.1 class I SAM-dependent methyltransferase [Bradyrhizobium brasilense]